jgi:hypothetical protein
MIQRTKLITRLWRFSRVLVSAPFITVGACALALGVWLHWDRRSMRQAVMDLFQP